MKLLLHICCANCAIYPVKTLRARGVEVTGYFFNHNIHPYGEFRRRLDTARQYADAVELPLIVNDSYALDEFLANVAATPAGRCPYCYQSRLEEAARFAAAHGFAAFSSSLLYSRYQQHDLICASGAAIGQRYGIDFLYEDFRTGWQEGIVASKALGLYRQQYCGCIYSERDRYQPRGT